MLTKLFDTEPTLVVTFVRAVLICAVAFGLHLSPEQIGAVLLVAETFLALVNRAKVTPVGSE